MARPYDGPFEPLPAAIRAQHPDMLGWEFDKVHPSRYRWEPRGWHVILPDGILTYDLRGYCLRDRVLYA